MLATKPAWVVVVQNLCQNQEKRNKIRARIPANDESKCTQMQAG
jgi:hypothetical protein